MFKSSVHFLRIRRHALARRHSSFHNSADAANVRLAALRFNPRDKGQQADKSIVILHGLYGSSQNWRSIAQRLHEDIAHLDVNVVDLRNHGNSPHVPDMSIQLMVNDVCRYVQENNLQRVLLLGHSMGGLVVQTLALQSAAELLGLVVVDIAPRSVSADIVVSSHVKFVDAMQAVDLSHVHNLKDADALLASAVPDAQVRRFLLTNLRAVLNPDRTVGYQWKLNLPAIRSFLPELSIPFQALSGHKYAGPTMFVSGSRSGYILPSDVPRIRELFPHAEMQVIDDAGHWVHHDKPREFLQCLSQFINTCSS